MDEVVPPSAWEAKLQRARAGAGRGCRTGRRTRTGIVLTPLQRAFGDDGVAYPHVRVAFDRAQRRATITVLGPTEHCRATLRGIHAAGAAFWPLAMARELDDAILHLRLNEPALGLIVLRSEGDPARGAGRRRTAGGAQGRLAGARNPPAI